jgi:hypothetical protein
MATYIGGAHLYPSALLRGPQAKYIGGQHLYPSAASIADVLGINHPSAAAGAAAGAGRAAPPATKPPEMTPEEWAREQAQQYVDTLIQGVNDQRQAYLDQLQQNAQMEAQRGQALAQALQQMNVPGAIQNIFGTAGGTIAGLAQGFGGSIRDTAQQDTAAQQRMLSGTGQEGAVPDNGQAMGDAFYGAEGFIPGQSMAEQGANWAAQAALEPGFAQRIGQVKAGDTWAAGQAGLTDFAKQIADIKGGQFGMEQDLLKQRQSTLSDQRDYQLQQAKFQLSQINDDRNYWLKMQAYYQATGKLKLAQDAARRANHAESRYSAAEKRLENATMGLDAAGNVAPGYTRLPSGEIVKRSEYRQSQKNKGLDENGNVLPGFKRTKGGKVVKVATPRAGGAGGLTPGQQQTAIRAAMSLEKPITAKDLPELARSTGLAALQKDSPKYKAESARLKKSIGRALWVRYAPQATTPAAKKALRQLIARLVRTYDPSAAGSGLLAGL